MDGIFPSYIKIDSIKYYKKSQKIEIYVSAEEFIKEEVLIQKKADIKKVLKLDDIDIIARYKVDKNDINKLKEYENVLRTKINEIYPSTRELNGNLRISYNEEKKCYDIIITKSAIYNLIMSKDAKKTLSNIVKEQLSTAIEIEILLEEDNIDMKQYEKTKEQENKNLSANVSLTAHINYDVKKSTNNIKKSEIKGKNVDISQIVSPSDEVILMGEIYSVEVKNLKNDKRLIDFVMSDDSGAIYCKKFINDDNDILLNGQYIKAIGKVEADPYKKELVFTAKKTQDIVKIVKRDLSLEKMVELHAHTSMSQTDAIPSVKELFKKLKEYEHTAVAIADHAVVQAYPDIMEVSEKQGIKAIYGCEFYLIEDTQEHIKVKNTAYFENEYVVFDIETTGFSNKNDAITEIGAVKIKNCKIVDTFSQLINPRKTISDKIQRLTGISDELVKDKPFIEEVLPNFLGFCKGSILVAHNADFDTGFIREKCSKQNLDYNFDAIDTLVLSRLLIPDLKNHKLNTIANELSVSLENHHRAVDDATATANIFLKFIEKLKEKGIENFNEVNNKLNSIDYSKIRTTNAVVLAKNQEGIKDLYKLVSLAHTKYLQNTKATLPKSELKKYRKNLLIGSGFYESDIFSAILSNNSDSEIENLIDFYDYVEINPITTMRSLVMEERVKDFDEIRSINTKIFNMATKMKKIVIASSNPHYLEPKDKIYRKILKSGIKRPDENPYNDLEFRTTDEMIKEFLYLGEDVSKKIVIENTNLIASMIEDVRPIPNGTFPPIIEGSDEELRTMCYKKARRIYSDTLPEIVETRLEKELSSIISNGYAVMYIIAQKLVTKSLRDGYLVGSRGSVGSSLAAYMSDITEVNALPPHYVCPACKNSEFITDGSYPTGADMPDKNCPNCNEKYVKDGFDIPFETFLGFEGDKEPDIDLNFAGEYQANAHRYTQELFGEDYVYRAGTIATVAEKTAYGFIKKYEEVHNEKFSNAYISILQKNCTGVKRTSGQHPGGVMVVPKYKDIYDFSPIQYPANDKKSATFTTHFDYHSISGRILKLDILGHDGPSIIKQLENLTNTNGTDVALDDKETMELFSNTKSLNCTLDEIDCTTGTLGIPEFGTKFVRQMLIDTNPTTLGELIRISGLSHGTDVWVNNAQDYVKNGVTTLKDVISTRDDIMNYLILKGLAPKTAFKIMENVRKGKGLYEDNIKDMKEHNVPTWYIESCNKIKYMFPKAHAAAYVMLSFRIAYYKVHYPSAFYATYFTTKVLDFDASIVSKGKDFILDKIKDINMLGNNATVKEKGLLSVLEVAYEMYKRGIILNKVDLYKSDARKFKIDENGNLIPPFLAIQGLGDVVAEKIYQEAKLKEFISIEDLKNRTGASKNVIQELLDSGCIEELSATNQIEFSF